MMRFEFNKNYINMNALTLRLPETLQNRLKQSAQINHRSVNKQAVMLLEQALATQKLVPAALPADVISQRTAALMAIGKAFSILPVLDSRSDDEILGYDDYGLPT